MVMTKAEFAERWEKDDNGDGITVDEVAECAVAWGLYHSPKIEPMDQVIAAVVKAAGDHLIETASSAKREVTLRCDMTHTCDTPVTHIGDKGFIYCTNHAGDRKGWERVRKLRPHELNRLKRGQQIAKY